MKIQKIKMNGQEVELQWGVGEGLGTAVYTVASDSVGDTGPSDGDTFEIDGTQYRLGQHDYSTDQPGHEDDDECECTAPIYSVDGHV